MPDRVVCRALCLGLCFRGVPSAAEGSVELDEALGGLAADAGDEGVGVELALLGGDHGLEVDEVIAEEDGGEPDGLGGGDRGSFDGVHADALLGECGQGGLDLFDRCEDGLLVEEE